MAQYDYDPYGQRTKLSGAEEVDFGYTGHYHHTPSGLNLTLYRAYNPTVGRWISKDPIEEKGGINLYGYVSNNPLNLTDPFGLEWWNPLDWMQRLLLGGFCFGQCDCNAFPAGPRRNRNR